MKKFLTLAVTTLGLAFGVNAQRQTDLEVFFTSPGNITTNCNDSMTFTYGIVNNGPNMILPTDTIVFFTPFTATGFVSYIAGDTVLKDSTVFVTNRRVKQDAIQRLFDPNSGTYLFPPYANGTYGMAVEIIGFGLGDTATSSIVVDNTGDNDFATGEIIFNCSTVGIKGLEKNNTTLKVFPNPVYNQVSFTNDFATATTASVRITDIAGRVVRSMDLGKQNTGIRTFRIDIADLNNGMYYLELVTETARSISKFTKQ